MDISHPQLVAALVKPPLDILNTLSMDSVDLWHGATGVAGETGELVECLAVDFSAIDVDNLMEELGDLCFYMEQIRQRIDMEWLDPAATASQAELTPDMLGTYTAKIVVIGCGVLDTVKKYALYNVPLNTDLLRSQLAELDLYLEIIMLMFGLPRAAVLGANINKLRKRYGEQYSDQAAAERADKQNRSFIGKSRQEVGDGT